MLRSRRGATVHCGRFPGPGQGPGEPASICPARGNQNVDRGGCLPLLSHYDSRRREPRKTRRHRNPGPGGSCRKEHSEYITTLCEWRTTVGREPGRGEPDGRRLETVLPSKEENNEHGCPVKHAN